MTHWRIIYAPSGGILESKHLPHVSKKLNLIVTELTQNKYCSLTEVLGRLNHTENGSEVIKCAAFLPPLPGLQC